MKTAKLGDYLLWEGKPAKIVYEANDRTVGVELFENCSCPHCGGDLGKKQISVIPTSPMFQNAAEPMQTINQNKDQ